MSKQLEYRVSARRIDAHGSLAETKDARIDLDTDLAGRRDAFNPAELLLAAVSACMIKGIERVAPMLSFEFSGVSVSLHAIREDAPPRIVSIDYVIEIDTAEPDRRLELLHTNIRKFGTVSNTVSAGARLEGVVRRKGADQ